MNDSKSFVKSNKRIAHMLLVISLLATASLIVFTGSASAGCVAGAGTPISGATVSLSPHSQYSNISNATGCYNISDVPYGSYFMVTTHPAYEMNISSINVSSAEVSKDIEMVVCRGTFSDTPCDYWAYPYVMYLNDHSITSGCGGGAFCPGDTIDRAMTAVFLTRALNLSYTPGAVPDFNDVPPEHWAYTFIMAAKQNGIINGYANGNYGPGDPVTRGELAVMVKKGRGWTYSGYSPVTFTDVPTDYWAYSFIMAVREKNIIGGYPDGTFRPGNQIMRSEAAVMISKMSLWY